LHIRVGALTWLRWRGRSALDRAAVDAFFEAAVAAGAEDNGAPGVRPHYHESYYAAFVHDADGNNIEAVCHRRNDDSGRALDPVGAQAAVDATTAASVASA
jgi:hypothetical protein